MIEENKQETSQNTIAQSNKLETQTAIDVTTPFQNMVKAMEELLKKPITEIKEEIEQIKKSFLDSYYNLLEEKKTLFQEENTEEENNNFQFDFPLKKSFDKLYTQYKNLKNQYALEQEKELAKNLEKRKQIIEELKTLVDQTVDFGKAFKQFDEIRSKWNSCGNIPKDKYNIVWNDYHFHVERFFDHLHLDREMRDKEFQINLEKKQALIQKAHNLLADSDLHKAIRELQVLHKIWKEETGPVAQNYRESLWTEFCDISNQIHKKFDEYKTNIASIEKKNLEEKLAIVEQIKNLDTKNATTHEHWQNIATKINELKDAFVAIGNVPHNNISESWNALREALKNINQEKKKFYKGLKQKYQEEIQKREELIKIANENKDNNNFEETTPLFIKLQNDWKQLSFIPRKQSEKLWNEFRSICDEYFNKLNEFRKNAISAEIENFDKKKEYLKEIKNTVFSGNHQEDLDKIKAIIEEWKTLGNVPPHKRHIESKFNKVLDLFFNNLNLSRRENELHKFNNKISQLIEQKNIVQLKKDVKFIYRKIEEIEKDILTIENNSMYIQNGDKENPLIKECLKKITKNNEELNIWKEKLEILKKHL